MNETHHPVSRAERARLQADLLILMHDQLQEVDPLGELGDLREHLARKIRLLRETARMAAAESGR